MFFFKLNTPHHRLCTRLLLLHGAGQTRARSRPQARASAAPRRTRCAHRTLTPPPAHTHAHTHARALTRFCRGVSGADGATDVAATMIFSPVEQQIKAIKAAQADKPKDLGSILQAAGGRAFSGGIAGAGAMVVQVSTLMWMRTTMNYQYRHGTTTMVALRTLYADGGGGLSGVLRFYKGFLPALVQGPLSRFGDTAANAGALALLDSYESTKGLPVGVKTLTASASAAGFRMFLMPVDCLKTTLQVPRRPLHAEGAASAPPGPAALTPAAPPWQVEGKNGLPMLAKKIKANGPGVLWYGAVATATATFVGHYPWLIHA